MEKFFEEELAKEAHAIIDYWDNKTLSIDEQGDCRYAEDDRRKISIQIIT